MYSLVFLCLTGFLLVQSSPIVNEADYRYFPDFLNDANTANDFFDGVIKALKTEMLPKIEPFKLPTKDFGFEKKVGPIKFYGKVNLHDGEISGLSSIHRSGDCQIGNEKGNFKASVELAVNNMKFHYHADLEFMHIKKGLLLEGGDLLVDVKAVVIIDSASGKPQLVDFKVVELRGLKLKIHGLGILDPLINLIMKAGIALFNTQIKHFLETKGKDIIGGVIKDFKMGGYYYNI